MATLRCIILILIFLMPGAYDARAQQPVLRTSAFSAGGNESNGSNVMLQSTLGQAVVGRANGDGYVANAGFWYQVKGAAGPVVVNNPPAAPQITDPVDGTEVLVGGSPGAPPLDPGTAFTVSWTAVHDPDGDPVVYTWELASDSAFTNRLLYEAVGAGTQFETTLGDLAAVLDDNGITLGHALTLWHRAVASDGQVATAGTAVQVRFVRGTLTSSEDDAAEVPGTFSLHPNYPNPFNPTTTIAYDLAATAPVRLVVYDVFGRQVARLVDATQPPGRYEIWFDAARLASGTYFYRIEAGPFRAIGQMLLVK